MKVLIVPPSVKKSIMDMPTTERVAKYGRSIGLGIVACEQLPKNVSIGCMNHAQAQGFVRMCEFVGYEKAVKFFKIKEAPND